VMGVCFLLFLLSTRHLVCCLPLTIHLSFSFSLNMHVQHLLRWTVIVSLYTFFPP
jgi:hypothetical protein